MWLKKLIVSVVESATGLPRTGEVGRVGDLADQKASQTMQAGSPGPRNRDWGKFTFAGSLVRRVHGRGSCCCVNVFFTAPVKSLLLTKSN